jgi:hypothetical protein
MASEFNGTDCGAMVFKFCANIVNFVVIFIGSLEDQRFNEYISKFFTFVYIVACWKTLPSSAVKTATENSSLCAAVICKV